MGCSLAQSGCNSDYIAAMFAIEVINSHWYAIDGARHFVQWKGNDVTVRKVGR